MPGRDGFHQRLENLEGDFKGRDEEELLKQLWDVGTRDERKVLATLVFKLVQ